MRCEVSVGELLDKIAVLRIKKCRITDEAKLAHVRAEQAVLEAVMIEASSNPDELSAYEGFIRRLVAVNLEIWEAVDKAWAKERRGEHDTEFMAVTRRVLLRNDERFQIKAEANARFASNLQEQKSYDGA